ncbi:MAG: DegT/DnrJ/EryC1/StrS family aminotransferase [Deltaproteobacteria bacterium]|nr:DegT/DnrJ/EryC1/StrS family aminotransferase [Deltaproteobacteria bacterium]
MATTLPFVDLKTQFALLEPAIRERMDAVLNHGQYIMGPEIEELEGRLARFVGSRHAVACGSGTDALLMALLALGVGPGDAVFTSPFTFVATAEVVSLLGATPVFVDIDPRTFNMAPEALSQAVAAMRTKDPLAYPLPANYADLAPKAIIAVDLFGLAADYDAIRAVADEAGLPVIEDAAQSLGAGYKGRVAGNLGLIGCTSFFPAKPLGCYGDGGMCFTDDPELDALLRSIRNHGQGRDRYENVRVGINGRLDTLQAAILLAKLDGYPEDIRMRDRVAAGYTELLGDLVPTPVIPEGYTSVWAQYTVMAQNSQERDRIRRALAEDGIPTAVYYPKPLHLQKAFAPCGYSQGVLPVSESASHSVFSLPMHPYVSLESQKVAAQSIRRALAG